MATIINMELTREFKNIINLLNNWTAHPSFQQKDRIDVILSYHKTWSLRKKTDTMAEKYKKKLGNITLRLTPEYVCML